MNCLLVLFFVAISTVGFSSFLPVEQELAGSSRKTHSKSSKKAWKEIFRKQIETRNFRALGYMAKAAVKYGVPISKLQKYAAELEYKPLQEAFLASQRLASLKPRTGLTLADCVQLAVYIETEFATDVKERGNYRSRNSTGLPRTVEYDPQSARTFIHLKSHGGMKLLGKGFKKVVTRSIQYDKRKPEVVAHCITTTPMESEIAAIRALQGLPGLFEVKAITERKAKDNTQISSLMCKLYPYNTLSKFLHKGSARKRVSFKDKMRMALDILKGLESMHSRGYVHRDLSARNYLVYRARRENSRGKRFSAVIADLGRTIPAAEAAGRSAQSTSFYRAPEALDCQSLVAKDYFQTDIYAVGCVLHSLFFGKAAPWVKPHLIKDATKPAQKRVEQARTALENYRQKRFRLLMMKNPNRNKVPMVETMERFILVMVDPVPIRRRSAKDLCGILENLIKRTNPKPLPKQNETGGKR